MPKEVVYGTQLFKEDGDSEIAAVVVRWSREAGDVQIATKDSNSEVWAGDGEIPVRYGYHVDLDRRSINALIRNLRRARDQAFGRDE